MGPTAKKVLIIAEKSHFIFELYCVLFLTIFFLYEAELSVRDSGACHHMNPYHLDVHCLLIVALHAVI